MTNSKPMIDPVAIKKGGKLDRGFYQSRLQNRFYGFVHATTGRAFLVMGHPTVHKWWCDELKNGKYVDTPCQVWTSKKDLIDQIEQWIKESTPAKPKAKPRPAVRAPYKPAVKATPGRITPLKRSQIRRDFYKMVAPDDRAFYIERKGQTWECKAAGSPADEKWMPICKEEASFNDALHELQLYLDPTPTKQVKPYTEVTMVITPLTEKWWAVEEFDQDNNPIFVSRETAETLPHIKRIAQVVANRCNYKLTITEREK